MLISFIVYILVFIAILCMFVQNIIHMTNEYYIKRIEKSGYKLIFSEDGKIIAEKGDKKHEAKSITAMVRIIFNYKQY